MKKKIFVISMIVLLSSYSLHAQDYTPKIKGIEFMEQICGQWAGPVTSTTPAGNFPMWYVDFRPISGSEVAQFSMLDSQTVNNMHFLIVKHDNEYKVAMRTKGCFDQKCCITYEIIDSVNVDKGYYRFADFQKGMDRAYTEFQFKKDRFEMKVYTTKFGTKKKAVVHTVWKAELGTTEFSDKAIQDLHFPELSNIPDFTHVFDAMDESIIFDLEKDPYQSSENCLGSITFNIYIDDELEIEEDHELFILLCTASLFDGLRYIPENSIYYSKYIYLPINTRTYTMRNVHPGTYYIYSYNDINQDKKHKSGDYMSSNISHVFEVKPNENTVVNTTINVVIP